jgi:lipase maturation factor 1
MPFGESFVHIQGLFLKSIGLVYLIAFSSLAFQVKGLFGAQGIAPIQERIQSARLSLPSLPYWQVPSLFWFYHSDRALMITALFGIASSLVILSGFFTSLSFLVAYVAYLSFTTIGKPFMSFQWDNLLLETGLICFFYSLISPAPPLFIWVLWLLIFRFMFASGFTKLVWGSKEWRELTAMDFHYETQPLPTKIAYYAHQQPRWFSRLSVLVTFFFELALPILIFTPESIRIYTFGGLAAFQLLIALTGNFTFFNLLAICLCLPLLSDPYIAPFSSFSQFSPLFNSTPLLWTLLSFIAAVLFFFNALALITNLYPLRTLDRMMRWVNPLQIGNTYGLFVHMTTSRFEITIEGSKDGKEWREYHFRYKPGPLDEAPRRVAPHHPRLDWHMWFAALNRHQHQSWFSNFLAALLNNSPDVLKLLRHNPFPDVAPTYLRCRVYRYEFTTLKEKRQTGHWWKRTYMEEYVETKSVPKKD